MTRLYVTPDEAAGLLAQADADHAQHPQYANYWDGWRVVEVTAQVRTKLGVAFEPGDLALAAPPETVAPFRTVYSTRNKINTSVQGALVREVPIVFA
jgi:hypothetical protein